MNKLLLIGLTLSILTACNKKQVVNNQAECEKQETKKWVEEQCVDREYYTFTLKGDEEGKWKEGATVEITVPQTHHYNTLTQVGDCVKIENVYFSGTTRPSIRVFDGLTVAYNSAIAPSLTPQHYNITQNLIQNETTGNRIEFGVDAAEGANTAGNCKPIQEDIEHPKAATTTPPGATTTPTAGTTTPPATQQTPPASTPSGTN